MVVSNWDCAHPDHWHKVLAHNDDIDMQYGPLRLTPHATPDSVCEIDAVTIDRPEEVGKHSVIAKTKDGENNPVVTSDDEHDYDCNTSARTEESASINCPQEFQSTNDVQFIHNTINRVNGRLDINARKPLSYPEVTVQTSDLVTHSTHFELESIEIYSSAASVEVKSATGYIGTYRSQEGIDQMFGITVTPEKPVILSQIKLKFFSLAVKDELFVYFIRVDGKSVAAPAAASSAPPNTGMMPMHLMSLLAGLSASKVPEVPKATKAKPSTQPTPTISNPPLSHTQPTLNNITTRDSATAHSSTATATEGSTTTHNNSTASNNAQAPDGSVARDSSTSSPYAKALPEQLGAAETRQIALNFEEEDLREVQETERTNFADVLLGQLMADNQTGGNCTGGEHTRSSHDMRVHNKFSAPETSVDVTEDSGTPSVQTGTRAVTNISDAVDSGTQAVNTGTVAVNSLTAAVNSGTSAVNTGTSAVNSLSAAVDSLRTAVEMGTHAMRVSTRAAIPNPIHEKTALDDTDGVCTEGSMENMHITSEKKSKVTTPGGVGKGEDCMCTCACTCRRGGACGCGMGVGGSDVERMLREHEDRMKRHIDAQMQGLRDGIRADVLRLMSGL